MDQNRPRTTHGEASPSRYRAARHLPLGLVLLAAALTILGFAAVDARSRSLLFNSLGLSAASCALCLPLAVLLACLLARTDLPGRRAGLAVLTVLLFVPFYVQAAAWQSALGMQGWLRLACGGPTLLQGWTGAVGVHTLAALPWATLIVSLGLRRVDPELEDQALLDGSAWRTLWKVTLRVSLGAISLAALWVAILTTGEMTVTDLFSVRTFAEEIYTSFATGPDPQATWRAVAPGIVLSGWLALGAVALVGRLVPADARTGIRSCRIFPLGNYRVWAGVVTWGVLLGLAAIPLASLGYQAGLHVTTTDAGLERIWSAQKCLETIAASPLGFRREMGWSLAIGTLAATAATVAGTALGWFARRGSGRVLLLLAIAAIGLSVPGPVVGLAVIRLLNHRQVGWMAALYDQSILAPWLALTVRGIAPAALIAWQALRTVSPEMLDAAAVDGAGRWARFWRVGLPSRLSAVALTWLVVLVLSLGDLAATVLVVPPGMTTLSLRIFDLLHTGVQDRVAGICLTLVGIAAVAAWAAGALARRWGRRE